jgi:nitroreductase
MTAAAASIVLPPAATRSPDADVDPQFIERWSRRALSDRPLSTAQIQSLFEAARWAPSANNLQPWLFVYASQPESLARARELLVPTNQRWANRAPLLVFVFARKRHPETLAPLRTSAFDTGAAWQSLALQASKLGLSTRAMGGIHHDRVHAALGVPVEDFESMIGIAIGYPGTREVLPNDLHEKEQPNTRKRSAEFAFEGRYSSP